MNPESEEPKALPPQPQPQKPAEVAGIALSMRIPAFWRERARLWFCQFEAATSDLHKSSSQLAQMVIAQLERQDIEQIADLLYNPPAPDKYYETLKTRLISVYEDSDDRQLQKLLSEVELGDLKPTQLLRRMKSLAREKVPDSTLQLMWTNHLPPHVRSVLAVSESFSNKTALDELALLADKMLENTSSTHVSAVEPSTSRNNSTHQYLVEEIKKLSLEVAELKNNNWNHRRNYHQNYNNTYRSPYRNRSRSVTSPHRIIRSPLNNAADAPPSPPPPPYCYYHRRFGTNARKCTSPCDFKKTNTKPENYQQH